MKINYYPFLRWRKELTPDPLSNFRKNAQSKIRSTLTKLEEANITYHVGKVDDAFLHWFLPLYEENIRSKANPRVINIRERVAVAKIDYYYLAIYQDQQPIGATIFSYREDFLSIAFRTYTNKWPAQNLRANPDLLGEYLIHTIAAENNYHTISHGKDGNPYGFNSSIGLAAFKLSMGCVPYIPSAKEIATLKKQTLETDNIDKPILVFACPTSDIRITDGYLIGSESDKEKWKTVFIYDEQVKITFIPFSTQ